MFDYLKRLPGKLRYKGNWKKGELELLQTEKEIQEVGLDVQQVGIMFEDSYVKVMKDGVLFPNGKAGYYRRVLWGKEPSHKTGAAAFCMTEDGRIVFRYAFRHAVREWSLESVRGFKEEGDSIETTVLKEVKEELGYEVQTMEFLQTVFPDNGALCGEVDLYFVKLGKKVSEEAEEGEALGDFCFLSLEEFEMKVLKGEIQDSFTLLGWSLAKLRKWI